MSAERSLNEIALETGTDKSDRFHGYTHLYERYFHAWRRRPLTLLEIGVLDGASLRMWREYFPKARICGLDRDPRCADVAGDGMEVFIGDQSDERFLAEVLRRIGRPDLVIDDGSHIGEHQIGSFEALFPALQVGGLYVVEDLHASYWGCGARSAIDYFKGLVDDVMIRGRSRCAEITNDPEYSRLQAQLGYFERSVESVLFHRSIIFIRKRAEGGSLAGPQPVAGSALRSAGTVAARGAPGVAIVIPVHNALDYVRRSLTAIVRTCPDAPLVVVDDCSSEETQEWLCRFLFEEARGAAPCRRVLLRNDRQQLFTRTVNRGIRRVDALRRAAGSGPIEFVAVVNTDCELQEGWLKALLLGMEDPQVGLVGFSDRADGEEPALREMREPDFIVGHCLLLRMKMLEEIGVFCETDTGGSEDSPGLAALKGQAHVGSDRGLSWRANRAGWKTLYTHCQLCGHPGGGSWHNDLAWLAGFDLQPLWPPCDALDNPGWAEESAGAA